MNERLNKVISEQLRHHHRNKALIFFEAAMGELMDRFTPDEVLEIVESYTDLIEEVR